MLKIEHFNINYKLKQFCKMKWEKPFKLKNKRNTNCYLFYTIDNFDIS